MKLLYRLKLFVNKLEGRWLPLSLLRRNLRADLQSLLASIDTINKDVVRYEDDKKRLLEEGENEAAKQLEEASRSLRESKRKYEEVAAKIIESLRRMGEERESFIKGK